MPLVPARLPIRTAALLSGLSEPTFRRVILDDVRSEDGGVSRAGLERYLQREIGPETYLAAVNALEPRRARERRYKRIAA